MKCENKFVNISICKSNIKSKKNVYFARVCKTGKVGQEELLHLLKETSPYIDINMMRAGLEKMIDLIIDLVSMGKEIDFFNLGTFSIASKGKIEVKRGMHSFLGVKDVGKDSLAIDNIGVSKKDSVCAMQKASISAPKKSSIKPLHKSTICAPHSASISTLNCKNKDKSKRCDIQDVYIENENADYDISESILESPQFALKFTPSDSCKKFFKNVQMGVAIKKKRCPVIEGVENTLAKSKNSKVSIIRISGSNLKVLGDDWRNGVYIREENGVQRKIDNSNILQNSAKMLLIMLDKRLKNEKKYNISIITQYVGESGNASAILRSGSFQFVWKDEAKQSYIKAKSSKDSSEEIGKSLSSSFWRHAKENKVKCVPKLKKMDVKGHKKAEKKKAA